MNKEELIKEYRKLGADMHTLREQHIIEKEACIAKYKQAKAEIQAKRAELLIKIMAPAEKAAPEQAVKQAPEQAVKQAPEQSSTATDAERAEIEAMEAEAETEAEVA